MIIEAMMETPLSEKDLFRATAAMDRLFSLEEHEEELKRILKDESAHALLKTIFAPTKVARETEDAFIDFHRTNATIELKRCIALGLDMKTLLAFLKNFMGERKYFKESFELNEALELIKSMRDNETTTLSKIDLLTGYYLLNKALSPAIFELEDLYN